MPADQELTVSCQQVRDIRSDEAAAHRRSHSAGDAHNVLPDSLPTPTVGCETASFMVGSDTASPTRHNSASSPAPVMCGLSVSRSMPSGFSERREVSPYDDDVELASDEGGGSGDVSVIGNVSGGESNNGGGSVMPLVNPALLRTFAIFANNSEPFLSKFACKSFVSEFDSGAVLISPSERESVSTLLLRGAVEVFADARIESQKANLFSEHPASSLKEILTHYIQFPQGSDSEVPDAFPSDMSSQCNDASAASLRFVCTATGPLLLNVACFVDIGMRPLPRILVRCAGAATVVTLPDYCELDLIEVEGIRRAALALHCPFMQQPSAADWRHIIGDQWRVERRSSRGGSPSATIAAEMTPVVCRCNDRVSVRPGENHAYVVQHGTFIFFEHLTEPFLFPDLPRSLFGYRSDADVSSGRLHAWRVPRVALLQQVMDRLSDNALAALIEQCATKLGGQPFVIHASEMAAIHGTPDWLLASEDDCDRVFTHLTLEQQVKLLKALEHGFCSHSEVSSLTSQRSFDLRGSTTPNVRVPFPPPTPRTTPSSSREHPQGSEGSRSPQVPSSGLSSRAGSRLRRYSPPPQFHLPPSSDPLVQSNVSLLSQDFAAFSKNDHQPTRRATAPSETTSSAASRCASSHNSFRVSAHVSSSSQSPGIPAQQSFFFMSPVSSSAPCEEPEPPSDIYQRSYWQPSNSSF